jgi:uncharacterized membrane protein YqjE
MAEEPEKSISSILHDVMDDVTEIVRTEIKLAKTELKGEANEVIRTLPVLGVGMLFGLCATAMALTTAMLALGVVLPYWAAALILFAITAILAGGCAGVAIARLRSIKLKPVATIHSMEENAQWLKTQMR